MTQLSRIPFDKAAWLRVSIYDQPKQSDDLFHIGTLYGKGPDILGTQVAKILRARWKLATFSPEIDRDRYQLKIPIHRQSDLLLEFTTPGHHGHRSRAQWFGMFVRSMIADLSQMNGLRETMS